MLVVVTPNANRDLTTVAAVKAELGILGSTEIDAKLAVHITHASNVIADHCNRVFAIEEVEETFDVGAVRFCDVMLSRFPVTEVVSVTEGDTLLPAEEYAINPQSGIIYRMASGRHGWWSTGRSVITYKAGYTLPAGIPSGLGRACIELVKQYFSAGSRDPMIRSDTTDGVGSTEYFNTSSRAVSGAIAEMLEPYRKVAGS